jgi:hypothetical protein
MAAETMRCYSAKGEQMVRLSELKMDQARPRRLWFALASYYFPATTTRATQLRSGWTSDFLPTAYIASQLPAICITA